MCPPLTFGVEFEFSLAAALNGSPDPHPSHPGRALYPEIQRVHAFCDYINSSFHQAGLPTQRRQTQDSRFWYTHVDTTISPPHKDAPCQSAEYKWHPMEVNSPAYYFLPEALDQVRVACAVITSNYRAVPVRTAGLHVHVGNGVEGFSFETVRNLVSLLWVFERQFSTLHPPHRHDGQWCSPLSKMSVYGHHLRNFRQGRQIGIFEVLEELFSDEWHDMDRLVWQMGHVCNRGCAVKFANLTGPVQGTKKTIEFRQHASTLDGEETVMWIKTVVGLLEFARDVDEVQFTKLMIEFAEVGPEEFTVVQLLRKIGLKEQARYYSTRLYPLDVREDDIGLEFRSQNLAEPRLDVLERFGVSMSGKSKPTATDITLQAPPRPPPPLEALEW